MTDDLALADATTLAGLVRSGDATPSELVDAAIARIESVNPALNAVIHTRFEEARREAAGPLPDGPFRGVPVLVKDLDGSLTDAPLHMGNRLLKEIGYVAEHDSELIARLKRAGFVIVGKTNTPEFGLLPTTEPRAYGATRNPWSPDHSPGGSSGGSAAAVAAGLVPVAHAGDGGGSIRTPAAHCGLVGLKPSRGRVTLGPDFGEAWAGFLQHHALTRTVRDSAAVLSAVTGPLPGDPYTAPPPARPYTAEVGAEPGRLRIGIRTDAPSGLAIVDPRVVRAVEDAGRLLESLGHVVEPASPAGLDAPGLLEAFSAVIAASTVFGIDLVAKTVGRALTADDVEPFTWMQYELGRAVTAGQYLEGVHVAHTWARGVVAWWQDFDLLLTATTAEPAPRLGDIVDATCDPFRALERAIPFVAFAGPFNVTGQPAISLPLSWTSEGIPIGVQLVADQYHEDVLFRVAAQLEAARPWADRRPPITA
jgi:amidase